MREFIVGILIVIMMVGFIFACFGYTWGILIDIAAMLVGIYLID